MTDEAKVKGHDSSWSRPTGEKLVKNKTTDSLETLAVSGCDEKVGRGTTTGLLERVPFERVLMNAL